MMQLCRCSVSNGAFGFEGVDEEVPIWERNENWSRTIIETESKTDYNIKNESMSINRNGYISIISQAFYGNRTGTEIKKENIDRFILGYLDDFPISQPIDRTIIKLPNSDNLVLIYNKYKEDNRLKQKIQAFEEDNYIIKPLAVIPELDLEIYSRCIVCRMNDDGEFESIEDGDYDIWNKYLAL